MRKVIFKTAGFILSTIYLLGAPYVVSAQSPVYVDVSQCRNINVALARVACYDALADHAMQQGGAADIQNQEPQSAQPLQQGQPVQQGYIRDQMQEKNRKMREELARMRQEEASGRGSAYDPDSFGKSEQNIVTDKDGDRIMYDRIKELQTAQDGWVITLTSGQVWRQMYNKRYNLKEGQQVKIAPTIWGNAYRLSVKDLGGFIQVERVK